MGGNEGHPFQLGAGSGHQLRLASQQFALLPCLGDVFHAHNGAHAEAAFVAHRVGTGAGMHDRPVTLVKAELEVFDPLASHGSGQRRLVPGDGQTGLHIVNTEYVARGMPQKGLVAEAIHGLQRTVEQGQAAIAVDDANALLVGLGQHSQLFKRMRFGHRRVGRVLGGDLIDMGRACQKPRADRPGRKHQHQDHGIQPGIRSCLRQGHGQPDPQCHHGQGEHQRTQTPTARHRRVQNQAL